MQNCSFTPECNPWRPPFGQSDDLPFSLGGSFSMPRESEQFRSVITRRMRHYYCRRQI